MKLYLGEWAREHIDLVRDAAELWNAALTGFDRRPVISIVESISPRNFSLGPNFWKSGEYEAEDNADDGQSVIYFKGGEALDTPDGFAYFRWDRHDRMVESDAYINTTAEDV